MKLLIGAFILLAILVVIVSSVQHYSNKEDKMINYIKAKVATNQFSVGYATDSICSGNCSVILGYDCTDVNVGTITSYIDYGGITAITCVINDDALRQHKRW